MDLGLTILVWATIVLVVELIVLVGLVTLGGTLRALARQR